MEHGFTDNLPQDYAPIFSHKLNLSPECFCSFGGFFCSVVARWLLDRLQGG